MIHEVLTVGPLQCNCSILGDEETQDAIVIDPGDEVERILGRLKAHDLRLRYILNTHAHFDHIGNCAELKAATGAEILLHQDDLSLYQAAPGQAQLFAGYGVGRIRIAPVDRFVRDAESIQIGKVEGRILHTPGHSPGSLGLLVPAGAGDLLLAGDTLFQGSVGRTDLPGGDYEQLLRSIQKQLLCLDDDTLVWPGHGPRTTIGRERRSNPFLRGL